MNGCLQVPKPHVHFYEAQKSTLNSFKSLSVTPGRTSWSQTHILAMEEPRSCHLFSDIIDAKDKGRRRSIVLLDIHKSLILKIKICYQLKRIILDSAKDQLNGWECHTWKKECKLQSWEWDICSYHTELGCTAGKMPGGLCYSICIHMIFPVVYRE